MAAGADTGEDPPAARRRWRFRKALAWLVGIATAIVALVTIALVAIDTDAGHRALIDRIEAMAPASGLKIKIGRIDGSLYGEAVLHDVRLYDTKGLFFRASTAELDWSPLLYLTANRLDIDRLKIPRAMLWRLPALVPSKEEKPILPGFDIRIGALDVEQLVLGEAISGKRHVASLKGNVDIRSGRAEVDLAAALRDGDDKARLKLVSIPANRRFDIDLAVTASAGGVLAAMTGYKNGFTATLDGDGDYDKWDGRLVADSAGSKLARVSLGVRRGLYSFDGTLNAQRLLSGLPARLGGPALRVTGKTTFADRRLDGTISLRSAAMTLDGKGRIDLGRNSFSNLRLDARLLQPSALVKSMRGRDIRGSLLLDGPMSAPRFEYRLTSPAIAFGQSGFEQVEARGRGRIGKSVAQIPVLLTAARATGMGKLGADILYGLRAEGVLQLKDSILTSDLIRVTTRRVQGKIVLLANLKTGDFTIGFDGALPGYEIPGLGRVDLISNLKVQPRSDGSTGVGGTATATLRRLDNGFLRGLAGGLPKITTNLSLDPGGRISFTNLRLSAPDLNLTASGYRRRDGSFHFEGGGRHARYGPLTLTLDGAIDRPKVRLVFASPLDAAGLADVGVSLDPTDSGYVFVAGGQSLLGPFTAEGAVLLPKGADAIIQVTRLTVANTVARGRLRPVTGGLVGALAVSGGGLTGEVDLDMVGGVQRIAAALVARDASFPGPPAITIRRGKLDIVALLDPAGTSIDAKLDGQGIRRGSLSIANVSASAKLVDGSGTVRTKISGARGREFVFEAVAAIAPGRVRISGGGSVDGRALRLTRPALLIKGEDGWRLRAAELAHNGGTLRLAGQFGRDIEFDAGLNNLPLALLDIGYPELGLGGRATGTIQYRSHAGELPTGKADLRVRRLSRSGVALSSEPIDLAFTAALSARSAAMRGIIGDGSGKTVGRIQGRVSPLASGGDIIQRIASAPLFAQLRYAGPSDTLWRLTGVDALDVSGPIQLAADVRGKLSDPLIRGTMRTENARIESVLAGIVLTDTKAVGRFDGSRLELRGISGRTRGGGTVTGSGTLDLASARGFGMDMKLDARDAEVLNRDDIGATVSGPLRITYDNKAGGLISGEVTLDKARFRLGQAAAAEALPVVKVTEINGRADMPDFGNPAAPWRLDLKAKARNQLAVTGLGIDSEWGADLAISGTVTNPRIVGTATLVRGVYSFAGRNFRLDTGDIRFVGRSPVDPVLDIVAVSEVSGINATINVRGTGQRPEISFASVPALPEDELLSRILFGSSITDISVAEAAQLGAALASLRGGSGGLDPINSLRKAVGLDRLRILPADATIGQGTAVAAGKYITRRLYVEVITDGQGYSATRAEFQIFRWLSILSTISTIGRQSANVRVSKDY
ncbi:translocation/assembly module TamB [Sphingorhabdus soli]|uniref:Translocation/assembly module TamB n=1 Tax=Flavisphingopyxis soli TaxID=2601267 RepID=A0A5C6U666_9SPHN|nr:translocation/assembly module TamB domain-containing protein [Sphingorhabdus soli]TXC68249.1 translocation/assembly module TamB [Sphingorhabdus soli]